MIYTLENQALQLTIKTNIARWSLLSRYRDGPSVEDAQLSFHYRRGYVSRVSLDRWPDSYVDSPKKVSTPHGPAHQITIAIGKERDNLEYRITFAMPDGLPMLFWRMVVENRGRHPIYVNRLELMSAGFIYRERAQPRGQIRLFPSLRTSPEDSRQPPGASFPFEPAFFSNGWQSWSYSGIYEVGDRYRRTILGPARAPVITNPGTPQPNRPGLFASDMFGVLGDRERRTAILAGFLSQKEHFGSLETLISHQQPALRLWANGDGARLDPGKEMATDWACLYFFHIDAPDPLGPYLEAVARQSSLDPDMDGSWGSASNGSAAPAPVDQSQPAGMQHSETSKRIPVGWCSWYHFFKDLSAEAIRSNLESASRLKPDLPLELIQIDDGYEHEWGDWFRFKESFPDGLAPLAAEARAASFTPGLWLAPFIVHPRSKLRQEHPDWLLRGWFNRPVNAGYFWGAITTALDLTHPDALEYTAEVVHTAAHKWGFSYLKLDFLYAGALPGRRRDATKTRAQVLRKALQALRAAAGDEVTFLGCGCPLGSAIGIVDAMRVSADVHTSWYPQIFNKTRGLYGEYSLPAVRNAVHNTLAHAALHHRWWINDPDCLILRPETRLSLAEIQTLATVIALSGGSLLLSDHLPGLPDDRLRIAKVLFPLIGKRPHILDWFDGPHPTRLQVDLENALGLWSLLALLNWEDTPQDLALCLNDFYLDPTIRYNARSFWDGETYQISPKNSQAGQLTLKGIPAHGVALLAVRPDRPYNPQYLGSDLHISQGMEVRRWEVIPRGVSIRLERPGFAQGHIELSLPRPPQEAVLNGAAIHWTHLSERRYRFPVVFEKTGDILISFSPHTSPIG